MNSEEFMEDLEMYGWERQISKIEQEEDLQNFVNSYRKEYCYE